MGLKRHLGTGLVLIAFFWAFPAYANSSWHWVAYSPQEILPYAVLVTLAVETTVIARAGGIQDLRKAVAVIAAANIVSFVFPYLERALRFLAVAGSIFFAWDKAFNSGPYYIIMAGYLALTLALEIPAVYVLLGKHAVNKERLLAGAVASNVLTTAGVFFPGKDDQ